MRNVREVTYELLRRHGMTTVFGNPGSNELPFLRDFPADFEYVLGLHEGVVVAMADGYAQAKGQPVLVNLHAAAGTGNALGVLTNSVYSHSPLVITAGQQVRNTVGQQVMLSNVDAAQLTRPLTKWSAEPLAASDTPRTIAQAISLATTDPAGPTYVSVPYDDWDQQADDNVDLLLARRINAATTLTEKTREELLAKVRGAASPVLVLGPDVDAARANADAVRLAEALGAPVWIAPSASRCPFPTRHPLFRGPLPTGVRDVATILTDHDLTVTIGAPVFRYHHHRPGRYLHEGTELIHISCDPDEVARAPFGDAYLAPIGETVRLLADGCTGLDGSWDREPKPLADLPAQEGDRMHPATVFRTISDAVDDSVVYVNESTSTAIPFWDNIDVSRPGSFYSPAAGGLGFAMGAAVGVQLAEPERRVVAVIGDGSANYGITALWTAAHYGIGVTFCILNNGSYAALRRFGKMLETGETPGFDIPGIDFTSLAAGYGVHASRVHDAEQLRTALERAAGDPGPHLIEIWTTP